MQSFLRFLQFYDFHPCKKEIFHDLHKNVSERIFLLKNLYKSTFICYNNYCGKIILPLFDAQTA